MLINIDGGITGNLINMLAVSDPITGKILKDANRLTGDAREGLFWLHCKDWDASEIYSFFYLSYYSLFL